MRHRRPGRDRRRGGERIAQASEQLVEYEACALARVPELGPLQQALEVAGRTERRELDAGSPDAGLEVRRREHPHPVPARPQHLRDRDEGVDIPGAAERAHDKLHGAL